MENVIACIGCFILSFLWGNTGESNWWKQGISVVWLIVGIIVLNHKP